MPPLFLFPAPSLPASMHFEEKTLVWFKNFNIGRQGMTWELFLNVITARFDELKEGKIITKFNKLKHQGSLSNYVKKFEELRAYVLMLGGKDFNESYFIASFISGLHDDLHAFLGLFVPVTVTQAIEMARK